MAHTYENGDSVVLTSTGTLPSPLTEGTVYYVRDVVPGVSYKLAETKGGPAIDITDAGTGTHTSHGNDASDMRGSGYDAGLRLSNLEAIGCYNAYTISYNDYVQIDPSVMADFCENPLRIYGQDKGVISGWYGMRRNQSPSAKSFAVRPYEWASTERPIPNGSYESGFTNHLKLLGPTILTYRGFQPGTLTSSVSGTITSLPIGGGTTFNLYDDQVIYLTKVDAGTLYVDQLVVSGDHASGSTSITVDSKALSTSYASGTIVYYGQGEVTAMELDRVQESDVFAPVVDFFNEDGLVYRDVVATLWIGGKFAADLDKCTGSSIRWDSASSKWCTDRGLSSADCDAHKARNAENKFYFTRRTPDTVDVDDASGNNAADVVDSVGSGTVENIGGGYIIEDPSGEPLGYGIRINDFDPTPGNETFSRGLKVYRDSSGYVYAAFFVNGEDDADTLNNWAIGGGVTSGTPTSAADFWIYGDYNGTEKRVLVPGGNIYLGTGYGIKDENSNTVLGIRKNAIGRLTNNTGGTTDLILDNSTVTDSTGGTTDGTLAAISGSGADADINNNFAEIAASLTKLNNNDAELHAKLDKIITVLSSTDPTLATGGHGLTADT